jgi:hypothetical protein
MKQVGRSTALATDEQAPGATTTATGPVASSDLLAVMTRIPFQDAEDWAWQGVAAPVPGVMKPCFEVDQRLVATQFAAAAGHGARHFVSDIEQPSPRRDTGPYRRWAYLGFEAAYRRSLFTRPPRPAADQVRSA